MIIDYNKIKGISATYLHLDAFRENDVQFDMSSVCVTGKNGEQVTIDNEDFEKMIAEYQRRQKRIAEINK